MLDDGVDAAAAGAFLKRDAQLDETLLLPGCDQFDVAFEGVLHPAAQTDLCGFAMDVPAEANTLNAAFDEKMVDSEQAGHEL